MIVLLLQAEAGIRGFCLFRGLGDWYKRQTENWSVLANVWRDFMITERIGCYGGGGIGGGGLTLEIGDPRNFPPAYTLSIIHI